jgi:hypothetical protein
MASTLEYLNDDLFFCYRASDALHQSLRLHSNTRHVLRKRCLHSLSSTHLVLARLLRQVTGLTLLRSGYKSGRFAVAGALLASP